MRNVHDRLGLGQGVRKDRGWNKESSCLIHMIIFKNLKQKTGSADYGKRLKYLMKDKV